jgi:hypothetical protein
MAATRESARSAEFAGLIDNDSVAHAASAAGAPSAHLELSGVFLYILGGPSVKLSQNSGRC